MLCGRNGGRNNLYKYAHEAVNSWDVLLEQGSVSQNITLQAQACAGWEELHHSCPYFFILTVPKHLKVGFLLFFLSLSSLAWLSLGWEVPSCRNG